MLRTTYAQGALHLVDFLRKNTRLLVFFGLFLIGVFCGTMVFLSSYPFVFKELAVILDIPPIQGGFTGAFSALFSSCFSIFVLLGILFLSGLSACGTPITALVPIFFGLGIGLAESYHYASGKSGVAFVALFLLPHTILAATSLVMGCTEALRMSLLMSSQLLPSSASCGGLWEDFRLYCIRFLVFSGLAFTAGILDVCMRLFFYSWVV